MHYLTFLIGMKMVGSKFKAVLICLVSVWIREGAVQAQHPFFHKYTTDDGLIKSECTNIFFAKNGEAWVRYSSGDCYSRFDGVSWTHYSLMDLGLPTGLVLLAENDAGLWFFVTSNGSSWWVCYTPSGQWKVYPLRGMPSVAGENGNPVIGVVDPEFYEYRFDPGEDKFIRGTRPLFRPLVVAEAPVSGIAVSLNEQEYIFTENQETHQYMLYYGEGFTNRLELVDPLFQPLYIHGRSLTGLTFLKGRYYWFSKGRYLPLVIQLPNGREGRIVQSVGMDHWDFSLQNLIMSGLIVQDPVDNTLHLYELDSLGSPQLVFSYLHRDFNRTYSEDAHGNWWYGTATGLVRTDKVFYTFDGENPQMIAGLHVIGEDEKGQIWLGGYSGTGGFSVYDGALLSKYPLEGRALPVLPGVYRSPAGNCYFFTEHVPSIFSAINGKLSEVEVPEIDEKRMTGLFFTPLSDGKVGMGLASNGIGIATLKQDNTFSVDLIGEDKGLQLLRIHTIAEDHRGRLWLGNLTQGLALYDRQRDTAVNWVCTPPQTGCKGAISSCIDGNGDLWLGGSDGLYRLKQAHLFDYDKDTLFSILKKIPLPGSDDTDIGFLKDLDNFLVFGSQRALYFLDKKYSGTRPRIFTMQYGQDISGSGSEQNAVLMDSKGYLWIGTQEGATRIDLTRLRFDTTETEIKIISFLAGNDTLSVAGTDLGELPLKKRSLEFTFQPSGNPLLKDDLFFDVLVVDSQGDTLLSQLNSRERAAKLSYLKNGNYSLIIRAYKHNVISGDVAFKFSVPPLLMETLWFRLVLTALLVGIPMGWLVNKKRLQAKEEKEQRERDNLRALTLSNFFNPHFINNTLHWIQTKYRKDPDTAVIIGRLSENLGILFSNTQYNKTVHRLHQEWVIVQNYLKIQQVRFDKELEIRENLPENPEALGTVQVPALMVQIHVENAVEKGLQKRKGANLLLLDIHLSPEGCQITIEDNGLGRPEVQTKSNRHRRSSTEVMDDLIRLFNLYNREKITVSYEDRIFSDPIAGTFGTRVIIFIPKNYQYELSKA
ncbi:MAG: histidine kinase [Lewinellaceae bacterium]|nr:histidine kinase [Lewinellaceae bacterium]